MSKAVATILVAYLLASAMCLATASAPEAPKPASVTNAPGTAPAAPGSVPVDQPGGSVTVSQPAKPGSIAGLANSSGKPGPVGLNEELQVKLTPAPPAASIPTLDASKYALFFNGREVKGLPDPIYDPAQQSLVFELKRNDTNKDLWTSLLGSPSLTHHTRQVTVALRERTTDARTVAPAISGEKGNDALELEVLPVGRFWIALLVIGAVIWLVFWRARNNTALRDGLIPQIEPRQQTYSLARCQMAFWFVLIFCSFVFLYIITWDYNTISQQAVMLMGISGTTALAAVVVDALKDSPADAANRALQALGFNSYDDVVRVRDVEIPAKQAQLATASLQLKALPPPPPLPALPTPQWAALDKRVTQLQLDIDDWMNRLVTYKAKIRPFLTQGWFKDVTTDINGTAVHRLQVFCWTGVLGAVFLIGVYRDLTMPEFGATLLALMGISSAGYVGFKYPEKNN